jgi:hypothetical protein
MKEKHAFPWQWCPQPERIQIKRPRPIDKAWVPLITSALILSLLAIQGVQVLTPSTVSGFNPNSYGAVLPAAQTILQTPSQAPQASQTTTSISTDHFTVQFTFPESADPGNTITVSAITTAKSNGRIVSLTADVFSYVDSQLVKSASETIATDRDVGSGDNWQTSLTVVVPTNVQRGPLIGVVTEVWQEETNYYYSNYYSDHYFNYCLNYYRSLYPNYDNTGKATRTTDNTQTYPITQTYPPVSTPDNYTTTLQNYLSQSRHANQPRYLYEPSQVCEPAPYYGPNYGPYYAPSYTTQVSSEQTFPLTYILATTPEYVELQKTNEQLQKDNNDLVAKNNDLASEYNSLKTDYDQTVAKYNQLQSDYNSKSEELGNYRSLTYAFIALAAVLAVLVVALVIVVVYQRRPVVNPPAQPTRRHEKATPPAE